MNFFESIFHRFSLEISSGKPGTQKWHTRQAQNVVMKYCKIVLNK